MADAQDGGGLSKSAKRRAAKKARDEAGEESAAPVPEAKPKAEPKPKAKSEPKAKAEAKADPKAKAKAKSEPKSEPKAKAAAKGEAKAQPAAKGEAKAKAKQNAKAAAPKAKSKAKDEDDEPKRDKIELNPSFDDDGTGGDWEEATGLSKKQQKRKERQEAEKLEAKAMAQGTISAKAGNLAVPQNQKAIPGMAPVGAGGYPAGGKAGAPAAPQSLTANAAAAVAAAEGGPKKEALTVVNIKCPDDKMARVIGKKGVNIKLIQEKTGISRMETSAGEGVTLTGSAKAVELAEIAVRELLDKGYTSLAYENFQEHYVNVHPSAFPDLIGKGGETIIKIKEGLGVEIDIPPQNPNAPKSKKYKVALAGKNENVEKAKEVINSIVMYGYSELTHPGQTHEDFEVPEWSYRYIIGTKGSEMRHIQKNFRVKVNLPREFSANTTPCIVGEPRDVTRAKEYIENLVWKAENQVKGRDRDQGGGDDGWGDEEPEEDWMKSYLYKRS